MRLIGAELYKLLIKRKFIWIAVAVLIFQAVSVYVSLDSSSPLNDEDAAVYRQYMLAYSGELDEERVRLIEQAIDKRYEDEDSLRRLKESFISGEITHEEYKARFNALWERTKGETGFTTFVNDYYSAYDSQQTLADSSLWEELLGGGEIDFLTVFAVVYMVASLCAYDEELGINRLRATTKLGGKKLISAQLAIVAALSTLMPVIVFSGRYLIAKSLFKLTGEGNPLSSAELFAFSRWELTLGEAYLYLSLIRTMGFIMLALISMLTAQICKSQLYTLFAGVLTVYVPAYVLSTLWERYFLPIPSSLLSAVGYFSAAEYSTFNISESGELLVKAFTNGQLIAVFSAGALLIAALCAVNRLMWTKRRSFV